MTLRKDIKNKRMFPSNESFCKLIAELAMGWVRMLDSVGTGSLRRPSLSQLELYAQ